MYGEIPELTEKDKTLEIIGRTCESFITNTNRSNTHCRISPKTKKEWEKKVGYGVDIVNTPMLRRDGTIGVREVLISASGTKVMSIFVENPHTYYLHSWPCNTLSTKEVSRSIRAVLQSPLSPRQAVL